ncbi:MAG: serine--tRNA ligase [Candidatus Pacebacteria bacterium]|nr:serine--tRNA ligase [Candidatus Paceibacterota bacterium]MCD8508345.1 serine--tRNA ligase [Candidatus Paceibacterota bacterium]MCD8528110.1 serine--tRNA ligase [Candidatus Paceibacterota bacterium]MCD8563618.1 serine--tRNA ligase [Candidatus Paceibacterota bacterium]
MLDIHFIRNHTDIIKEAARKKNITVDIDRLLAVDEDRRAVLQRVEHFRAEQNMVSKNIATAATPDIKEQLLTEMRALKADLQEYEERLKTIMEEWRMLMLAVPNIPHISVPEGRGEEDNVEVATWGTLPQFDFPVRDHVDIMKDLDMVDFERGTKVHGFRGYFLKKDGAELSWAIWNYARDFFGARNFESFIAPAVVRKPYFYATGHLPNDAEDLFVTQDEDYLTGTSEVSMMGYYADEVLAASDFPKRFLAFSPCYRREAGSHSKDTKGLIRVHEFYKLEQVVLCPADHQVSHELHEEITRNFEMFLESLGIPYRRLLICTGDLSASKVKQYDIEAWFPSQNQYRELASASYFHDFQTRRFNVRYKDAEGNMRFAHSLNNTAAATPRLLVALVENFQQADGTVVIPEVLRPYMKKDILSHSL